MRSSLRAHKLLLVIYGGAAILACFELTDDRISADREASAADYLTPETNIADVSLALYPHRAQTLYYRAEQAARCDRPGARNLPVCRAHGPVAKGEIRKLLEEAIATGNRSIEPLLYNYAYVLVQEGAPDEQIDAAIEAWHSAHPTSLRPDPRVAYRFLLSQRHTARR